MRIIVFGTGEYYKRKSEFLSKFSIVVFVDNDKTKWGEQINGIEIVSPDEISRMDYDYICILSSYQDEIITQLRDFGIKRDKILKFTELGLLECKSNNGYTEKIKKAEIAIFSHLMNYTGAAIALFNMVKIIRKNGYGCVVLTIFDGPLKQEYEKIGVSVYEENNIDANNNELLEVLTHKRMIICNTIFLRTFVEKVQYIGVPVVWWVHESLGFVGCKFDNYKMKTTDNLHVYAVGRKAKETLQEKLSITDATDLLYMVDEVIKTTKQQEHFEIVFAVIGNVAHYKGQDIFLDAILLLPEDIREKCRFMIIGADESAFGNMIKEKAKKIPEVVIKGVQNRETIKKLYSEIDVVVCPSRIDTMPTVVVEGMMNKKCCIVSDKVGIADYITDMEDGIIFYGTSPENLMKKMMSLNKTRLKEIGKASYEIYANYFSEEVFTSNIHDQILQYY